MFRRFLVCTAFLLASPLAFARTPLEVWIMPNGANPQGILEERLADFQKETGIPAKVVVLDWGEAWSRINTALETGKGPDVLQLGTTWVSYLASRHWLAPLNSHLAEIGPERFLETSWNTTGISGNDTVYSVPWFMDVRVLMGNRRILDSMGIGAAQVATVQGFSDALRKLRAVGLSREGTVVSPYAFPGRSDWNIPHNFAPWIWSEGGDFVVQSEGAWRGALLDLHTVVGIRRYIGFILDSLANPATLRENTAQVAQRFNNGEQVFVLNTSEILMQTRISESEGGLQSSRIGVDGVRTFPVPAGRAGSISFVGGSNLAIPMAKAQSPDAMRLLLFLCRPDNLDRYTRKIGFLPPDRGVLQEWSRDSLYATLVAAAAQGRTYPSLPGWGNIEALLVETFGNIWSLLDAGGAYSDDALYDVLAASNARLDSVLNAPPRAPVSREAFHAALASFQKQDIAAGPEPESVPLMQKFLLPLLGLALVVIAVVGLALFRRRKE